MFLSIILQKDRTATQFLFIGPRYTWGPIYGSRVSETHKLMFCNLHFYHLQNIWCCCIQMIQHFPCATLVWLFSILCFQMSSYTVCTRRCIVTLVTIGSSHPIYFDNIWYTWNHKASQKKCSLVVTKRKQNYKSSHYG